MLAQAPLSIQAVSETLHVHRVTVWRWIRRDKLKAVLIGMRWKVSRNDLDNFLIEQNLRARAGHSK